MTIDQNLKRSIEHLLNHCGRLQEKERLLIVCDSSTQMVARAIEQVAAFQNVLVELVETPRTWMHGMEPTPEVAKKMKESDLILGLPFFSIAHTRARIEACEAGARFLSLPEYSLDLIRTPALNVDYWERLPVVRAVTDTFTAGSEVRVTTPAGTDIRLNIAGRTGNCCPGFVSSPGELGSPPDIESNVSPVEEDSEGIVVVDGSIPCPEIGLLNDPVTLIVQGGAITDLKGKDSGVLRDLRALFEKAGSPRAYILAECGVGLNPNAELSGIMLTDEGANGCMHFGFGSNATVGGKNDVSFHLDFVFRNPTLTVDSTCIIDQGKVLV